MDEAQLDLLISEAGPLDNAIEEIVRDEEGNWIVRIGDVDVIVASDAARGLLRLGAEIGVPAPESAAQVHEALLVYNVAGRETGDVVMALTAPGGSILQLINLPVAGLTPKNLIVPLVNLAERTRTWRVILANGLQGARETPVMDMDMDMDIGLMIRA
jgi:hypothetical protein